MKFYWASGHTEQAEFARLLTWRGIQHKGERPLNLYIDPKEIQATLIKHPKKLLEFSAYFSLLQSSLQVGGRIVILGEVR